LQQGQRVRLFILANLANFVTTREEVRAIGARLSRIESPMVDTSVRLDMIEGHFTQFEGEE
jgi:hypothetical protein